LAILGLLTLLSSVFASEQIHAAYLERLSDAYCLVKKQPLPASLDAVAAAVCYRKQAGGIEILLVQTKGGGKWTFPKGHIKAEERDRPWKAAAREAGEEAGVVGRCSETPLLHYLYPRPAPDDRKREDRVAAYLLEVESEQKPLEVCRTPRWFTLDGALAQLGEGGREPRYVREHKGVLNAAGKRLAELRSQV
jgi:8-oxo-dGTP pyrophosphatase MutT (NUDIX family)